MKKLTFLLLTVLLTGCLGTSKQLLTVKDGATTWTKTTAKEKTKELWWRPTTEGLTKKENPWEKHNQPKTLAKWHDPWVSTDFAALGVTKFKPTKSIQYRIIQTRPKVQVLIVPENEFKEFYKKYFKGKLKKPKSPLQDKLFPLKPKRRGKAY